MMSPFNPKQGFSGWKLSCGGKREVNPGHRPVILLFCRPTSPVVPSRWLVVTAGLEAPNGRAPVPSAKLGKFVGGHKLGLHHHPFERREPPLVIAPGIIIQ